jgi:transcriptional antiterminator RfaH
MDHINDDKRPWYVCHTKPKQEFRAAENLDRQGSQICAWQRKKSVLIPMFPRYMFLRPAHEQHSIAPVRSTLGVFGLVRFGTEPATIRDPTLQSLRALEEKLRAAEFASFSPFKQGDQVLIVDGPFKGLEGIVSKVAEERVSVLMTLLGRERSLDFPAALLKVS